MYHSIRPGQIWLDTSGKPIQAHGFSVFYCERDGLYYWYGENKEKTRGGPFNKVWHWGVRCYASRDLYNWEDKGLIIPPQPDDLGSPLHPTYCMDRPHILYCEKTGKYVAWLKIMCGTTSQFMSVMQADTFLGPYEFVHKICSHGVKGFSGFWWFVHKFYESLQKSGKMDAYVQGMRDVAKELDVPLADAYAEWKRMQSEGVDTTALLINGMNHPAPEMHKIFADKLFDLIFTV